MFLKGQDEMGKTGIMPPVGDVCFLRKQVKVDFRYIVKQILFSRDRIDTIKNAKNLDVAVKRCCLFRLTSLSFYIKQRCYAFPSCLMVSCQCLFRASCFLLAVDVDESAFVDPTIAVLYVANPV